MRRIATTLGAAAALLAGGCTALVENRLEDKDECTEHADCDLVEECNVQCLSGKCVPMMETPNGVQCGPMERDRCVAGECRHIQTCMNDEQCPCDQACMPLGSTGIGACVDAGMARETSRCEDRHDNPGICREGRCRLQCDDDSPCRCNERCQMGDGGEGMACLPITLVRRMGPCMKEDGSAGMCGGAPVMCQ